MLHAEQKDAVLLLILNRPEKRNCLHPNLIRDLALKLKQTESDESIRAVVLTGAGPSFCAGLDLDHLLHLDPEGKIAYLKTALDLFERIYVLPQPVIAAINGPAVAGGFDLAAICDLRLCVPTARFAQAEVLVGLSPMLFPSYEIVGLGRAKELAFTGDAISAEEAYRIGLINRIYPAEELLDQALTLAKKLTARPRQALLATKRLSREVIGLDASSAFKVTLATISERIQSDEHRQEIDKYVAQLRQRASK
jgi:enoyl-CoA hydratase/carnithine racemase